MALAIAIATLGILGKPADRPLINRAVVPSMVEKLTSDIVIRSLTVLGIAGINQAIARNPKDAIRFVAPITRDGPGWRADIDLPYGVTVADVMDKRDRMASALRRPLGCIWPEGDSTIHEGRLILWVGDKDLSKTVVKSPLLKASSHDVFKGIPFGCDPRGRAVVVPVVEQNILIGSQPGQGKTASVRVLASGAALDPSAELWIHELKGTGDLDPHEQNCHRYVSGIEDEAIGYAAAPQGGDAPRRGSQGSASGPVPGQEGHPADRRQTLTGTASAGRHLRRMPEPVRPRRVRRQGRR